LQDINFSVKQGEVLGIIGRNGAGKSTLLKILSKVTSPTKGNIKIKGRIASLLEVGTGFHPELTGRENIFLNGAILGMTKSEIRSKFDEIVAFSGVEKYIDTPVKRYSSGMYVRLAFAVAAHLEPEILIVDEVLAVGDAEFQKKCLGKMKDVSNEGRTVLFVSHNMAAVKELCDVGLFLQNGQVNSMGSMQEIIQNYVTQNLATKLVSETAIDKAKFPLAQIVKSWISIHNNQNVISVDTDFEIAFEIEIHESDLELNLSMTIESALGQTVFNTLSDSFNTIKGNRAFVCSIPKDLLNNGLFFVTIVLTRDRSTAIQLIQEVLTFEVLDNREKEAWFGDISHHLIRPKLNWELK
ncbi:MAG: ABC transporter ATP-binding protein, partial [Bacteroidota bacterium]